MHTIYLKIIALIVFLLSFCGYGAFGLFSPAIFVPGPGSHWSSGWSGYPQRPVDPVLSDDSEPDYVGVVPSSAPVQPDFGVVPSSAPVQPDFGVVPSSAPVQPDFGVVPSSAPVQPDFGVVPSSAPVQPDYGVVPSSAPIQPDESEAPSSESEPTESAEESTTPTSEPEATDEPQPETNEELLNSLRFGETITPGVAIRNENGNNTCSVAYAATNSTGEKFIITAGHCGAEGDSFFRIDQDGNRIQVGEIAKRIDNDNDQDFALIKVTNDSVEIDQTIPGVGPIAGVLAVDQLKEDDVICRIGQTTGRVCGAYGGGEGSVFVAHSDTQPQGGDSGGAAYVIRDGQAYAVGVTSSAIDAYEVTLFQALSTVLSENDLSLI